MTLPIISKTCGYSFASVLQVPIGFMYRVLTYLYTSRNNKKTIMNIFFTFMSFKNNLVKVNLSRATKPKKKRNENCRLDFIYWVCSPETIKKYNADVVGPLVVHMSIKKRKWKELYKSVYL